MRCSLLTLSTYLDNELAPDRAGEVEAHLVACHRCSSGLGYLREEKAHISALAMVHADEGAAEDLLGAVGLALLPAPIAPAPAPQFLLDLAESPKESPVPPPPDESGEYLELNGSPSLLAAPATPEPLDTRTEAPMDAHAGAPVAAPQDMFAPELSPVAPTDEYDAPADESTAIAPQPAAPPPPAPPQWSQSYTPEPSFAAPREPAPSASPPASAHPVPEMVVPESVTDEPVDAPEPAISPPHSATPKAASLGVALTGRASSLLGRARDAVSVRWALMRGASADDVDEDDDSFQIVSGNGAPERRGAHPGRGARHPAAPPAAATPEPSEAFAPTNDDTPAISFAPPEHEPLQRPAFTAKERLAAQAALRKLEDQGVLTRDDEPLHSGPVPTQPKAPSHETPVRTFSFDIQEPVAPPSEFPRPQPHVDEPAQPGRHQRALHRDGPRFRIPTLSPSRPKRTAPTRPSFVDGLVKGRLVWIFGAAVLMLGLIGLLTGKSVTPPAHHPAMGAVPNPTAIALPSAHANATPTPAATPQPTPQPTPTPVPTPAAANPNQLTGAQNLGAGGTGFSVQDIRYGAHPGDFRIVFDLSGSGSPTTTVGFGNSTTLYVIFTGTAGTATVAQPAAGNTATAVKLLQPSPISGKTIYEFTLSGPAKLSTMYLQSPLRLVIDLS